VNRQPSSHKCKEGCLSFNSSCSNANGIRDACRCHFYRHFLADVVESWTLPPSLSALSPLSSGFPARVQYRLESRNGPQNPLSSHCNDSSQPLAVSQMHVKQAGSCIRSHRPDPGARNCGAAKMKNSSSKFLIRSNKLLKGAWACQFPGLNSLLLVLHLGLTFNFFMKINK